MASLSPKDRKALQQEVTRRQRLMDVLSTYFWTAFVVTVACFTIAWMIFRGEPSGQFDSNEFLAYLIFFSGGWLAGVTFMVVAILYLYQSTKVRSLQRKLNGA